MKKRNYKQSCALALASDQLLERWTLLIFRELLIQPCRFNQLNEWLAGMGTNLLTNRLKELETFGYIEKQDISDKRSPYQLTDFGKSVEPIILELVRWGHSHLTSGEDYKHHHHWDLLAMKALFKPDKCRAPITVQFDNDELQAWVKVSSQKMEFGIGVISDADLVIDSTIAELQRKLHQKTLKPPRQLKSFISCF